MLNFKFQSFNSTSNVTRASPGPAACGPDISPGRGHFAVDPVLTVSFSLLIFICLNHTSTAHP